MLSRRATWRRLAPELEAALMHWASLEKEEEQEAPPENSEQPRRAPARPARIVALRPVPIATAEIITAARALIGLAEEAAIVSAEQRAAFDEQLVPGVQLSVVRALAFDLMRDAPIGSTLERAGRALLAELPRCAR